MPTRPHDDRLLDILEQWDRLRRAGHEANIEELCADARSWPASCDAASSTWNTSTRS